MKTNKQILRAAAEKANELNPAIGLKEFARRTVDYHALANPATVLALLDKLEAAERRNAELLSAAQTSLEYTAGLEKQIESAELRIGELERSECQSERQAVIDGLASAGEPWEEIEEYLQKWDAARAAATDKGGLK